jgi:hypothetical protein
MNEYIEEIESFIKIHNVLVEDEEFETLMYGIAEKLTSHNVDLECVEPILKLMEKYPCLSFGSPGALTHYMEKFYKKGYEQLLVQSVKRTPTVHTLWLLNRLINGADTETVKIYVAILYQVYQNASNPQEVRDEAKHFYEYQNK